ncbi:hypothetical protein HPB52_018017 [Rhipicephalus sanguineus]|uniref:Uncharacterized protein n=1 Tax=Rhipicephalus sanguineus TaxID=34632 RepID=A0A9D4T2F6_RHISA|nr:hypothetical protein HPB52_018017 [Rhipicephalus sanguineus]
MGSQGLFHMESLLWAPCASMLDLLPESLIWAFVVQLSSVLRTIHAAGLACRSFEPSKILVMGKSRLRLNCCGIRMCSLLTQLCPAQRHLCLTIRYSA